MYKRVKGMVGIEAAIVLIAFVIVAAALAFVALNMGFFTTQKSKEVIARGLEEASSALEVDGSIIGKNDNKKMAGIAIPLKLATGRTPIDIKKTSIKIVTADKVVILSADDIKAVYNPNSTDPFEAATKGGGEAKAALIEYQGDGDTLIEEGEKWVLVLDLTKALGEGLDPYEKITVEVKPPAGAPLTVTRVVPPDLSETYVVLG
ncbi:MAG TPA: flagellin [Pyrodictium sp.]|nr:flagellin [Pyrodictium sp.]